MILSWILLFIAIAFEVCGTTLMRLSQGFTRFWPSLGLVVCYVLCFATLTLAVKRIDLSIAYAIWSGVGTAAIAVIGYFMFQEPLGWLKVVSLIFVLVGVVGLKMSMSHPV